MSWIFLVQKILIFFDITSALAVLDSAGDRDRDRDRARARARARGRAGALAPSSVFVGLPTLFLSTFFLLILGGKLILTNSCYLYTNCTLKFSDFKFLISDVSAFFKGEENE